MGMGLVDYDSDSAGQQSLGDERDAGLQSLSRPGSLVCHVPAIFLLWGGNVHFLVLLLNDCALEDLLAHGM